MTFITQSVVEFARFQLDNDCGTMARLLYGLLEPKGAHRQGGACHPQPGEIAAWGAALFQPVDAASEIQVIGRFFSESRDAVSLLKTWKKFRLGK